jgi:predicted ATPase/DNA-binding XRE family transcriptional regulator
MKLETSFGRWLRTRRRALDLTQDDLARQVGCSVGTIRKLESEERRPSRQIAERLVDCLQIAADQRAAIITLARTEPILDSAPLVAPERLLPLQPLSNVPSPLTRLIGRKQNIAAVRNALMHGDTRLLTLIGSPGIGKTRLSIAVADDIQAGFLDGVSFVGLASIGEPELVLSTIAQTLGVRETTGRWLLDQLKLALRLQRRLLILDNFEQVLSAAPLIVELLEACPGLKMLVTSRAALQVRGERLYSVPPLLLPDLTHRRSAVLLARNSAVALFVERAQAAMPDFRLTEENAAAVAGICVRLEGLPLAIELAATRIKLSHPETLLARLEQRLSLLTDGARDLPPRHRTLRAAIDWSYNLLDAGVQTLFRRLSVFMGGCTLAAAEAVCNASGDLLQDVFDGLATLVDTSLLQREQGENGVGRFVMLETLREYALERLEASREAEWLRRQHAAYYRTLSAEVWSTGGASFRQLQPEYDNFRSALAWSQTTAGDSEVALELCNTLYVLWTSHGVPHEAIAALERSLNHPLGVGRTTAHYGARMDLGYWLAFIGNYAAAQMQFEKALVLARELGDTARSGRTLAGLGWLAREQGDSATAWARLSESLAIFRELDDPAEIAGTLNSLAGLAIAEEDPARAEELLAESRTVGQRVAPNSTHFVWRLDHLGSDQHSIRLGWTLNLLGLTAQLRGTYDRATQLHQESLAHFPSDYGGLREAYLCLGESALGLGHIAESARWLAQGLALSKTVGAQSGIAWCLAGLGSVAVLAGEPERAARLWGAAGQLRQVIGCRPAPATRATYERAMTVARAQLGEEAFAAAWAAGQAMTVEQAIAYALEASASDEVHLRADEK